MKKTGEWGEFFPIALSLFAYNETVAQERYPLTKAESLEKGYRWHENVSISKYDGPFGTVPDDIGDVADDILDKILICERSKKLYRIQKPKSIFIEK